jgi:hypothetical protein
VWNRTAFSRRQVEFPPAQLPKPLHEFRGVGTGAAAERTKAAVVHVQGFLSRGEEVRNTHTEGRPAVFDLSKRHSIPGLTRGIEGMRVGGKRELVVSPHLAYDAKGIPGRIPANAVIRFEVELLEVRESGAPCSELLPPGQHLMVFHPGEQARNLARWQFNISEAQSVGGVFITHPVPGATWRHARGKFVELNLNIEQVQELFQSVYSTLTYHPAECLRNDQMWADATEKANSVTRDQATGTLSITVYLQERGAIVPSYGLRETSPVLLNSRFYQIISSILEPHLQAMTKEVSASAEALQSGERRRLP